LAEFCAELEATPPFSALWWPEKTELNELALWNCIDSKYGNLAEERRSAFDIQFVLAKPHHVSPDGTKWITERSGALKFEVVETTTPGTTLFLAVSFAE